MKFSVTVTLKKDVLDPQGKVIKQTLNGMGFNNINQERQGKYFDIENNENNETKAKLISDEMRVPVKPFPENSSRETRKELESLIDYNGGVINESFGIRNRVLNLGSGKMTTAYGLYSEMSSGSGTYGGFPAYQGHQTSGKKGKR